MQCGSGSDLFCRSGRRSGGDRACMISSKPMSTAEQVQTRLSLLIRLTRPGPCDERAWQEFADHYTPLIYRWCVCRNLQDTDAKDVTQQVLLKLAAHLPTFTYDPGKSFRAWLRTLTYHAWVDFVSDQKDR